MIFIREKKDCCGCYACVQCCPKHCITMCEDNEGFFYPKVDEYQCVNCGLCEKVCPVINPMQKREPLLVYAGKTFDEEIRKQSSSGGVFTVLAEHTISLGGVVFGVGFDKDWMVEHRYTDTQDGIADFRGSKYVQSRIGDTFKQAERFLKLGKRVLFSGTPCQIAGLKRFLRKDYKNLITIDFICHGVPSPGVYKQYITEEKEKFAHQHTVRNSVSFRSIPFISKRYGLRSTNEYSNVQIESVSFRDKRKGWSKFSFVLALSKALATGERNTVSFSYTHDKNAFMRGFLSDLYLRPSCHACPARELKSGSDITLGDYWGIHRIIPEWNDDKGVSAIVVNSKKGEELIKSVQLLLQQVDYDHLCRVNTPLLYSPIIPPKRSEFYEVNGDSFHKKIQKLCRLNWKIGLKRILKSFCYPILLRTGCLSFIRKVRE